MFNSRILLSLIILGGIAYSIAAHKLTVFAALTGGLVAYFVFAGAGFTGIAMMTTFFILGSSATSWQLNRKQSFSSTAEIKHGRTTGQVLANAGMAGIAGLLVMLFPAYTHLFVLKMAASFSSATADTLSSELGTVYGRRFINIITLKPDECGLDGVISLEGTLLGIGGSCIIAIIYAIGFGWDMNILWIIIAGTAGNLSDSLMGALFERKGYINNNTVNFLNTLAAALVILFTNLL